MAEDTYLTDGAGAQVPERPKGQRELGFSHEEYETFEQEREGLDLASIWRILWMRRFWLLGAGALGLAIALAISLLQTPLYRATAVLELNPPTVPIFSGAGEEEGGMVVPTTDQGFLATQYGLLRSRNLAERVVQNLNLVTRIPAGSEEVPIEQRVDQLASTLVENLDVEPVATSRLVELSYVSESPRQAASIANAYAEAFLTSTLDRRFEATASARKFLQERLTSVREALNNSERRLVAYAKQNNLINTGAGEEGAEAGGTTSLSGASLTAINAALADAQQRRIAAEQRYRQAGSITEVRQSTAQLRQEKAALETEYREKATYLKNDYPEMVRLRSRINALEQEIREEAGTVAGSLSAEYRAALAEENSLRQRVAQLSSAVLNEQERSIQYNILKWELDTNRSLYDALLERFNEVGVAGGVGTPQASIVDAAEIPGSPFSPNIPRNLVLGLLLGLGVGAAVAFVYEFITDTIKTPEDVREKLHLAVLGVIPKKKRKEELSEQLTDRKSAISEAYSSLLTTLQFTTNDGIPRAIVVTSTKAAEGKSTTSFVLANSLAMLGRRVLLLDADMRRPSFVVEERADLGLSRLLVTNSSVQDHILSTSIENLSLMPSGPVPPNPAQILNSSRLTAIVEALEQMFDVVIIDAPPAHGFADAPLLAAAAGNVLLVVESGTTRRRYALEVVSKLPVSGSLVLGAALTKYQSTAGDYGYGYGYYEGYQSIEGKGREHELNQQLLGRDPH